MSWRRWLGILMLLALIWIWQEWPDRGLQVVFCDVGQGDAAVVVWGAFQALIDTGPSGDKLFSCLGEVMPFWDRQLELVFISHPQRDHNGALGELLKRYRVGKMVTKARANDVYKYKDIYFDILMDGEAKSSELVNDGASENEDSLVVGLRYFDFSVLFTADIGEKSELALLDQGVLKRTTVLKVPHHGSKYSSTFLFLEKLKPVVAVVSVGEKNTYGHPNEDTLMRLVRVGARVWRTDKSGTIKVLSDGERLKIISEK